MLTPTITGISSSLSSNASLLCLSISPNEQLQSSKGDDAEIAIRALREVLDVRAAVVLPEIIPVLIGRRAVEMGVEN